MATEQAPLGEREAASPNRGARGWAAVRGLLIGRPETGALFGAIVLFIIFAFIAPSSETRRVTVSASTFSDKVTERAPAWRRAFVRPSWAIR